MANGSLCPWSVGMGHIQPGRVRDGGWGAGLGNPTYKGRGAGLVLEIEPADFGSPLGEVGEERGCVGIAAADGDTVLGGEIVGEDGFAFEAPAAEDGFHAAEVAAVVEEGIGIRGWQGAGGAGAGEGGEGIGFEPAVGEGEGLGEELDIN